MLSFDFDYHAPSTLKEAVSIYQILERQGKQPLFYGGGTEVLTLGRLNLVYSDALIDIKNIPECRVQMLTDKHLVLGAALTLTALTERNLFPLLSKTARGVADHTARNKITLGGNICGEIFYREAVLPFLLTDSYAVIAGNEIRTVSFDEVFNQFLQLGKGEFLVQLITNRNDLRLPQFHIKRRKQWNIGYPLVTVASIKKAGTVRIAISGLCPFPFRSKKLEEALNNNDISIESRINEAIQHVPSPILHDVEGSDEYRIFVLKNTLQDVLESYQGGES
ncbi:FAD binding domain-containing protein [Pseudalkalibacillus caeni]|uniref:Xanthine dehydrogenase n=1 Tax=Exobacillus caeni TaxID=2574798 RepID=A0A5R9F6H3_9BACL|nr:FAD binding domain-containing protein [Pseudalkalibacillus caeni]TLS35385.1 xanthine dehydrogenase [Pseudalkalibacillus caeni]